MADAASPKPLSQTEISRYYTDLSKALQAGSTSPDVYLRMLKELKNGVSATEDLLRSTRIGIVVNKLKDEKQVKDDKVRDQASFLIRKWKQDIQNKKKERGGGADSPAPPSRGANGTPTPAPPTPSANGSEKWKSVKPESRSVATDGVDYKQTGNTTRDNCAKLMYDGLAPTSDQPPSHVLPIALAVEQACFDALGPESAAPYKEKIRALFQNLKNKSNSHLRAALLARPPGITPARFVRMSAEDMKSKEMLAADAALHKENMNNAMVAHEEKAISSMLQCGSCGQKKVSYSQAQTRSADEPMTTFCECTVCGKKWKFS